MSDELFGEGSGVHRVGKRKVYAGQNAEAALKAVDITPDFQYGKSHDDRSIDSLHRKLVDGDVYFVDNRSDQDVS